MFNLLPSSYFSWHPALGLFWCYVSCTFNSALGCTNGFTMNKAPTGNKVDEVNKLQIHKRWFLMRMVI